MTDEARPQDAVAARGRFGLAGFRGRLHRVEPLAPALLLGVLAWHERWLAEDGFIDLRVVQNLLAGHGPVYNLDERVEVYSNPLWVLIWAAVARVLRPFLGARLALEWIPVVLGLALAVAAVVAACLGGRRLARAAGESGRAWALGGWAIAAVPAFWDFSTSGLEGSLSFAWIGVSFYLLVRQLDGAVARRRAWVALFLGLGPLVRPDFVVYSACFLGALVWIAGPRERRNWLVIGLSAGALPVAYEIFRMGYFAALVPNTALAKEASLSNWDQGWLYLRDFGDTYLLWIPGTLAVSHTIGQLSRLHQARLSRVAVVTAAPVLGAALQAFFVVRVGGDFMHARMLLPSFFALMLPIAEVAGARFFRLAVVLLPWALFCALGLRFQATQATASHPGFGANGIADERAFFTGVSKVPNPIRLSDYRQWYSELDGEKGAALAARPHPPGTVFYTASFIPDYALFHASPWVIGDLVAEWHQAGIPAVASGPRVHIIDTRGGIADPITARLRLAKRDRPGHEKFLVVDGRREWVLARFFEGLTDSSGGPIKWDPARLAAAQAAYGCGDLAELRRAIEGPLTLRRFLQNLGAARRLTKLRIPLDVFEAERTFCHAR